MAPPLRTLCLAVVIGAVLAPVASAQCLRMGEYECSPALSYVCAFGAVDFSVSEWHFADLGGGQISVTASPGPLPVLLGSIDCGGLSFTAVGTVGGTCQETYTLTGEILSGSQWSGTFTAAYDGSCLDCTLQSWPVDAVSLRCFEVGEYGSSPAISYSCASGALSFVVSEWHLADLGSGQISVTASPGPLPLLEGTYDCTALTFTAVGTVGGACVETYTLTGEFLSETDWVGDFTAAFTGSCFDCTFQLWHIDSSVHTAVPEHDWPASWGAIKAIHRGR